MYPAFNAYSNDRQIFKFFSEKKNSEKNINHSSYEKKFLMVVGKQNIGQKVQFLKELRKKLR